MTSLHGARGSLQTMACLQCGAAMLRYPSQSRGRVFCDLACLGKWRSAHATGGNAVTWKGGSRMMRNGYVQVYAPWSASADKKGVAYLHRVIMEVLTGGAIPPGMEVHHKDGNRTNNAPVNLELLTGPEHKRRHAAMRRAGRMSLAH